MDEWSTTNLALVAYLVIQEHDILRTEWVDTFGRNSCSWVFPESADLADDVADFEGGNALVDPKVFNYVFGKLKREMMSDRV